MGTILNFLEFQNRKKFALVLLIKTNDHMESFLFLCSEQLLAQNN